MCVCVYKTLHPYKKAKNYLSYFHSENIITKERQTQAVKLEGFRKEQRTSVKVSFTPIFLGFPKVSPFLQ